MGPSFLAELHGGVPVWYLTCLIPYVKAVFLSLLLAVSVLLCEKVPAPVQKGSDSKWAAVAQLQINVCQDSVMKLCEAAADAVRLQDGAIEAIVEEHLRGRYLFVSANVINHPLLSHVHAKLGALLPFVPPKRGIDPADPLKPFQIAGDPHILDDSAARKSE